VLIEELFYDSDAVPFLRPWWLEAAAVMHVRPVVVTEECNLDLGLSYQVLKVFMHHKRIPLQVVLCPVELLRVADLLTFEIRYVEVDRVEVLGLFLEKLGFIGGCAF
jgi:hypothetical protein